MSQETPQHGDKYENDFIFLGRFGKHDLWYGPDACGPTIVARWSPNGPDYSSGMCFGYIEDRPDHPLVEARKRAEALGLDVERDKWAGKMHRLPNGSYGDPIAEELS